MFSIQSNTMLLAQKSLDYLWKKQGVISHNIANATTPGFKASYVTFEDALQDRLQAVRQEKGSRIAERITDTPYLIQETENESLKADGNNVDITWENVEMARTTLQYDYMMRSINDEFTRVSSVIKG